MQEKEAAQAGQAPSTGSWLVTSRVQVQLLHSFQCTPGAPHDEEVGVEDVAVVPLDEPGPQALGPTLGAPPSAGLRVGVRHAGQEGRVLPRHEGEGDAADLQPGSLSVRVWA